MDTKGERPTHPNETEQGLGDRLIKLGQWFNFFDKPLSTGPQSTLQTAHLKDIGPITGLATSSLAEKVIGLHHTNILFELEAPSVEPKNTADEAAKGAPGYHLVLWAKTPDKRISICPGKQDESEPTRVIFNEWVDVTGRTPTEVKNLINKRIPQPLTVKKNQIEKVKFRFDYGSRI